LKVGEVRTAIPGEVTIERPITDTCVGTVIVAVNLQRDDLLEFRQAEARQTIRLRVAALVDAAERRAAAFVDASHHRADQPLDRAMMFRMAFGAHF